MAASSPSILTGASPTDKAVGFFNDAFGVGWQNIINGTTPTSASGNVLFEMFAAVNGVILACVSVLMFYIVTSGIAGTAHEGEPLGKRYSTLWTPIRGSLSIALLMPLPWIKLSLIQAIAFKFIFFSISGASFIASETVNYMVAQGGAMTLPPAPIASAENMASEVLRNVAFQEAYLEREGRSYGAGIAQSSMTTDSDAKTTNIVLQFTRPDGMSASKSVMGSLSISCPTSLKAICDGEVSNAINLVANLRPFAKALASQWVDGANTPINDSLIERYHKVISAYASQSQGITASALTTVGNAKSKKLQLFSQAIDNNGWVWLGSYHLYMAKVNENAFTVINTKIGVAKPIEMEAALKASPSEIPITMKRTADLITRAQAGRLNQIASATSGGDPGGLLKMAGSLFMDGLMSGMSPYTSVTATTGAADVFANTISNGDPILNLQKLGHSLINTGGWIVTAVYGGQALTWAAEKMFPAAKVAELGAKVADTLSGGALSEVMAGVVAFLVPVAVVMIGSGVVLAYYLPMLPMILWVSAVVGWMVLTFEMIVAVMVWAGMHALPEGEGMAGQHGRQGYMLFLGILFRPALNVIGFFMSFVLIYIAGHFVGEAYVDFNQISGGDEMPSGPVAHIIGWVATILLGGSLMVIVTHKCFSLITWLDDHILRWSGAGSPSLGEHADEQRTSHMFAGAMSRTTNVMGGAANAAGSAVRAATAAGSAGSAGRAPMDMGRLAQSVHTQGSR